jgi:hypothetical protein
MTMPHTAQFDQAKRESYICSRHCDEAAATVRRIQDNLKAAKSHQESYTNKRRQPLQLRLEIMCT